MRVCAIVFAFYYGLIFICATAIGIGEASGPKCKKPMNRFEYVMPGFQVGCWLGQVP